MRFWIGRSALGSWDMLFSTTGVGDLEVPHAVVHRGDGGFFKRTVHGAYFECDRCGLALRLRITNGTNLTEAEGRALAADIKTQTGARLRRNDAAAQREADAGGEGGDSSAAGGWPVEPDGE